MAPIVVAGAGAAGLMAAIFASGAGADVVVIERTRDGGRKILISGGGRCNVLPSRLTPDQYITASSPNTLRKMLLSWPLPEQRRFFEHELGIALALEAGSGKLFPRSNRARDVRDALVSRARDNGASFRFNTRLADVVPAAARSGWRVVLDDGASLDASAVIIATGGLSVPATGSDGAGLRILERLGLATNPQYPALTPLTGTVAAHAQLAGVSLDVTIRAPMRRGSFEATGGFLFTHRGYSGPAVLNVSHLAVQSRLAGGTPQPLLVQWTGRGEAAWDDALRAGGKAQVGTVLRRELPDRLADQLLVESGVSPQQQLSALRREERQRLVTLLAVYPLPWSGDEGYRKAEVTGGGIALGEVDARSFEARSLPGLFVCGEALDAFGPIGGYNFAWAWATGRSAGIAAAAQYGRQHQAVP
ncbi:MAG TPA: aminoacetone oxidase family FAD-binding enzyme [Longimicrobiales bacterium]|nr:aminoacetone oxidase family FAD-binding enzyme [Longimicrobiales bacterium]